MFADYLTRGVKAGIAAGIVFGLLMAVVANPLVAYADEMNHAVAEEGHGHSHEGEGHHHDTAASMAVNKTVSVISSALWAVMLGGVFFGIAFYIFEPMIPGTGAAKSYLMGVAGFVTVSGAPWLVLPPVSPGAQQSVPVETRLLLYGGMMVAGALICLFVGHAYNRLSQSSGHVIAGLGAVLPFGLLAIPAVLAPTNSVEGALSPDLRAGLIGLMVFGQVLVWLLLASAHAQFGSGDSDREFSTSGSNSGVTAD